MAKRKFEDGETVIYRGSLFTIDKAYYERSGESAYPGWFYDLDNNVYFQHIAEADLSHTPD